MTQTAKRNTKTLIALMACVAVILYHVLKNNAKRFIFVKTSINVHLLVVFSVATSCAVRYNHQTVAPTQRPTQHPASPSPRFNSAPVAAFSSAGGLRTRFAAAAWLSARFLGDLSPGFGICTFGSGPRCQRQTKTRRQAEKIARSSKSSSGGRPA